MSEPINRTRDYAGRVPGANRAPSVYLAARYGRREELCRYKSDLEAAGYQVPARWLLGEHHVHGLEAARAVEADARFDT